MHTLRIWVYDDCLGSAVSGPLDVFATANALWSRQHGGKVDPLFRVRVESMDGAPVRTPTGLMMPVDGKLASRAADAIILPGIFCGHGSKRLLARLDDFGPLYAALRRAHARGSVVAANCSASFLLAESGLLEGRVATTTWWLEHIFRDRYPGVLLDPHRLLTEQDDVICSGATTAYFNLALRLVERFAGGDHAAACARLLLVDANRTSQAPYMTATLQEQLPHGDELVLRAQRFIRAHVAEPFGLAALAKAVGASERTVIRHFNQVIGKTPTEYAQALRMQIARGLLETSTLPVAEIGVRVGYANVSSFRRLFRREVGVLPASYRDRFSRRKQAE